MTSSVPLTPKSFACARNIDISGSLAYERCFFPGSLAPFRLAKWMISIFLDHLPHLALQMKNIDFPGSLAPLSLAIDFLGSLAPLRLAYEEY